MTTGIGGNHPHQQRSNSASAVKGTEWEDKFLGGQAKGVEAAVSGMYKGGICTAGGSCDGTVARQCSVDAKKEGQWSAIIGVGV